MAAAEPKAAAVLPTETTLLAYNGAWAQIPDKPHQHQLGGWS